MKKMILAAMVTVGILAVQTPKAQAHGNDAGVLVAGLITGAIIADALHPHTTVYVSQPSYCPPPAPVVCAPAPAYCPPPRVVYAPAPPVVYYREPVVRVGFGWGYRHDYRADCRDDRRDYRHDRWDDRRDDRHGRH